MFSTHTHISARPDTRACVPLSHEKTDLAPRDRGSVLDGAQRGDGADMGLCRSFAQAGNRNDGSIQIHRIAHLPSCLLLLRVSHGTDSHT